MRQREAGDSFLRCSLIVFESSALVGACNLVYHLFMARSLSAAEYGVLNALTALYLALVQPADVIETVITRFASCYPSGGEGLRRLVFRAVRVTATGAGALTAALVFFSGSIGRFLNIGHPAFILLLAVMVFLAFFSSVTAGILKGCQRFAAFGLFLTVENLFKTGLGMALVLGGAGVAGAMAGWAAGLAAALVGGFLLVSGTLTVRGGGAVEPVRYMPDGEAGKMYAYAVFAAVQNILFVAVSNADLILVRHFFPPAESGYYSIAQMVGRIMLVFPCTISVVLFAKASAARWAGAGEEGLLRKSLLSTAAVSGVSATAVMAFPSEFVRLISGSHYPQCVPLVKLFAVGMGFFSLCVVIFNYNLAMQRSGYLLLLALALVTEAVLIVLFHATLVQVLTVMAAVSALLFSGSLWLTLADPFAQKPGGMTA